MSTKLSSAYKTISEVVKILNNAEPNDQNKYSHLKILGKNNFLKLNQGFLIIKDTMTQTILSYLSI